MDRTLPTAPTPEPTQPEDVAADTSITEEEHAVPEPARVKGLWRRDESGKEGALAEAARRGAGRGMVRLPDGTLLHASEERLRAYILENDRLKRDVARTRHLERELEETKKLLQMKTTELRDAHTYLGTIDTVSHSDILRQLERVNSEIMQVAAQIADPRLFHPGKDFDDGDRERLRREIGAKFGKPVADLLVQVRKGSAEIIVVQLVLQAALARSAAVVADIWSVDILSAWGLEFSDVTGPGNADGGHGLFLRSLHKSIYYSGELSSVCTIRTPR